MEYDLTCPLAQVVSGANTGQKGKKSSTNSDPRTQLPPTISIKLSEVVNLPTSSLVELWQAVDEELKLRRLRHSGRHDPALSFHHYKLGHVWEYNG